MDYRVSYRIHMIPDYHSTTVEGVGASPELARKDAEAQLSRFLNGLKQVHSHATMRAFERLSANFDPVPPAQLRRAQRNPNRDRRLTGAPMTLGQRILGLIRAWV